MRKACLCVLLLFMIAFALNGVHRAFAPTTLPQNNRVFYFSAPCLPASACTLSLTTPIGSLPFTANLTKGPVTFELATLQSSTTLSGPIMVVMHTSCNVTSGVSLVGIVGYRYPTQNWLNVSVAKLDLVRGEQNITMPLSVSQPQLLIQQSAVIVEIAALSFPRHANVSLTFGSVGYLSRVVIPMYGYETLSPTNAISIEDTTGNSQPYFYLNAPSTVVVVKLFVLSALGITDVSAGRVNMTIIDPNGQPIKRATNLTMSFVPSLPFQYEFIASWSYSTNSTQGAYQVWVDLIDSQNNVALRYEGPTAFSLVPAGYVPFPYNLIPYFVVGAVGAGGGAGGFAIYRRRRRKSYLVPFDHFNALTGGGLNGGTVVTVEGNTGSGKTLLLEQLMGDDLRNARPCVFVCTGDFPSNIRASMKAMGIDVSGYEQKGLLTFVDGYSSEAGQESREKIFVPSLGDLTTLGIKITSALPSPSFKGGSLYFDSLTSLASKTKPDSIVSFVQSVGAKVKGLSGKAFFTVGLGIDETVQRQLEDTADCIVQMEAFEESGSRKRRLRIAKFRARKHQEGWALFTIEDGKGIIFYAKKP